MRRKTTLRTAGLLLALGMSTATLLSFPHEASATCPYVRKDCTYYTNSSYTIWSGRYLSDCRGRETYFGTVTDYEICTWEDCLSC
jgi:hypothetical protein